MTRASEPPRVLIVGTGALACLFGARLVRSGRAQVTLAGRWPDGLRALRTLGIRLQQDGEEVVVPVGARHLDDAPEPADHVLVLVKSHQTSAVARAVAASLAPDGVAVTLQNGLGNRETLEAVVGRGRVGSGVVTLGATLVAPGLVRATPGSVALGAAPSKTRAVGTLLSAAGFAVSVSPELDRLVWRKLVANCAINPLSALSGRPNGALLESPQPRATLVRAAAEVGRVAAAKGIDLRADAAELALQVVRETATNRSSMLQDLDRGARTEIDALNGAVVQHARALGVEVPVNESLWRRVLRAEGRAAVAAPVLGVP